ncbi:hypothetical protein [Streptomyces caniferus]|uniref:hypothetical protein n=1 Tax=Streptomyces caniferus TaxID=285557 RepID=UPI00381AE5B1
MKQRAARTVSFALAVATVVGTAALPSFAYAAQSDHGHEATRTALRELVEKGGLPGVAAKARDRQGKLVRIVRLRGHPHGL